MPDPKEELKILEDRVGAIAGEKQRKEGQLDALRKQRDGLLTQIKDRGFDPLTIGAKLTEMKKDIEDDIRRVKSQVPDPE